jgi:hypothetical protein
MQDPRIGKRVAFNTPNGRSQGTVLAINHMDDQQLTVSRDGRAGVTTVHVGSREDEVEFLDAEPSNEDLGDTGVSYQGSSPPVELQSHSVQLGELDRARSQPRPRICLSAFSRRRSGDDLHVFRRGPCLHHRVPAPREERPCRSGSQ